MPVGVEGSHPLLARRLRGPIPVWEAAIAGDERAWLDDHVLKRTVPFPGAAYVELTLAAARELYDGPPVARRIELRRALFLGRRDRTVIQLRVDPETRPGQGPSADVEADGPWTLHAEAALASAEPANEPPRALAEPRRR